MMTVKNRKRNSIDIKIADKRFLAKSFSLVLMPLGALVYRRVIQRSSKYSILSDEESSKLSCRMYTLRSLSILQFLLWLKCLT